VGLSKEFAERAEAPFLWPLELLAASLAALGEILD
jgi:hypothetical protein